VTHRGIASSFAVVTGHEEPTKLESSIDWRALGTGPDTLVFLMGVKNLATISARLIEHGRDPATPTALVRWGTTPRQQSIIGTLADIAERAEEARIEPPVVIVVGEVVELRGALGWFEERPQFGKSVLVTRARTQASELVAQLEAEGAEVIELPAIEIEERSERAAVDRALEGLTSAAYSWVVFTSSNGVDLFFKQLDGHRLDSRALGSSKVAAIGPGTAEALSSRGITADVVPDEYVAEALVEALSAEEIAGARVLLPRAEQARQELIDGLEAAGASVDELTLYVAVQPSVAPAEAVARIREGRVDIVTFASSSTVRNLASLLEGDLEALRGTIVATIGPITSATAREYGLTVAIEAEDHTIPGLVRAICDYCAREEAMTHA
ncbi:MAG TPA: uroporphyrinogen-III synthase, partial [Dehalococcoidia bacterium]|nr:uroporphyrinogen-III synthase [Dehalococcoidia bacterium]